MQIRKHVTEILPISCFMGITDINKFKKQLFFIIP
jgi:hypothetical protein